MYDLYHRGGPSLRRLRLVACRKLAALALGPRVNLLLSFFPFVSGLIIINYIIIIIKIYFFSWTFSLMIDKQDLI